MEHHSDDGPNGRTPPGQTPRRRKDAVDEDALNAEAIGGDFTPSPVPDEVRERLGQVPRELAESIGRPDLEDGIRNGGIHIIQGKPFLTMKGLKGLAEAADVALPLGLQQPERGVHRTIGYAARAEVEIFRRGRLEQPTSVEHALRQLYLANELYEGAQENAVHFRTQYYAIAAEETDLRERCIACLVNTGDRAVDHEELVGRLTAPSRNQAEKLVDTTPAMVRYLKRKRDWAGAKDVAEKELSVARRRHTTALTFLFALAIDGRVLPESSFSATVEQRTGIADSLGAGIADFISHERVGDSLGAAIADEHNEHHTSLTTDQEK